MTARFDQLRAFRIALQNDFSPRKCDAGALLQVPRHFLQKIDMPIETRFDCCSSKPRMPEEDLSQGHSKCLRWRKPRGASGLLKDVGAFEELPKGMRWIR